MKTNGQRSVSNWPGAMQGFISHRILEALAQADFPDELAAAVHRHEFVFQINEVLRDDGLLASKLLDGFSRWEEQNDHSRLLMLSLFKTAKLGKEDRDRYLKFLLELYQGESHPEVQIGLIFSAFHIATAQDEEDLCEIIDWVANHREQFDSVCEGYYGPPATCLEDLKNRLRPQHEFFGAAPLYVFNLRAEVGMTDQVCSVIERLRTESERPSCRKAVDIVMAMKLQ